MMAKFYGIGQCSGREEFDGLTGDCDVEDGLFLVV